MTPPKNPGNPAPQNKPLSLPFDPANLAQGIRVRPAEFSRMCDVSRQTVSRWVKNGVVLLYPDGTLNPADAAKRVIGYTDPAKLRARIFKDATISVNEWRNRALVAEEQLGIAKKRVAYLEGFIEETILAEELFIPLLLENLEALHACQPGASREAMLDALRDDALISAGLQLGNISDDDGLEQVDLSADFAAFEQGEGAGLLGGIDQ